MKLDCLLETFREKGERTALVNPDGNAFSYLTLLSKYEEQLDRLNRQGITGKVAAVKAEFGSDSIALLLALMQNDCIIVPIQTGSKQASFYMEGTACEYIFDLEKSHEPAKLNAPSPMPDLQKELLQRGRPGLVLFSSGSTGLPKGALHDLTRLFPSLVKRGTAMTSLALLLFDHIGGFNTVFRCLSSGGSLVCISGRDPASVCRAVEKHRVELLPASPTFLNLLLISGVFRLYDLSSLKMITYGTESMPQTLLARLGQAFPSCVFKQTYGLSELGILPSKSRENGSLWMKLGGNDFETRIKGGTLHIRTGSSMLGYINAPSPFDSEGWFDTGDKVEENGEYYRILGRASEIINVGGEKVYPAEIESALMEYPGVLDARVSRESNPLTGEAVAAEILVEAHNNNRAYKNALRQFCAERLQRYKIPVRMALTTQSFAGQRLKKIR